MMSSYDAKNRYDNPNKTPGLLKAREMAADTAEYQYFFSLKKLTEKRVKAMNQVSGAPIWRRIKSLPGKNNKIIDSQSDFLELTNWLKNL